MKTGRGPGRLLERARGDPHGLARVIASKRRVAFRRACAVGGAGDGFYILRDSQIYRTIVKMEFCKQYFIDTI